MQPLGLRPDIRGKVRDVYRLDGRLLLVATDRVSAFDVVLPDVIPFKGEVLTKLSLYWFDLLFDVVENHLISAEAADLPAEFAGDADRLRGRFMLVREARVFPVECIVRGYLAGGAWSEYQRSATVSDHPLPAGLRESERLERPLFTPTTKARAGEHDEGISLGQMASLIGADTAAELEDRSVAVYSAAHDHALERGVIIADTKLEFGLVDGRVTLVDEVLTPDSSRFWPAAAYRAGRRQPSLDKQLVRDWLADSGWDLTPPAPRLPREVIEATSAAYITAYEMITGRRFEPEGSA
ncbi:MAG TPA: phosphoribosylaminoimidazolesuccinocarboxamide synthase [Coriobacteriia bacterium]|nr:phosphoribosylaminoimidazolesuccinocarboxamide synthase [Coriobacteriia bacterium]